MHIITAKVQSKKIHKFQHDLLKKIPSHNKVHCRNIRQWNLSLKQ